MSCYFDAPSTADDLEYQQIRFRDLVADDHPVRFIERFVQQTDVTHFESKYKVGLGQKGRAPKGIRMMLCVILYAIYKRIYSARQIDYSTQHHADFWFFTHAKRISHDKISEFINMHETDIHKLFLATISLAHTNQLLYFEALYQDGFMLRANASKKRSYKHKELNKMEQRLSDKLQNVLDQLKSPEINPDAQKEKNALANKLSRIGELREMLNKKIQQRTENKHADKVKLREQNTTINMTDPDSDLMRQKDESRANSYLKVCAVDPKADIVIASTVQGYNHEGQTALPLLKAANDHVGSNGSYKVVVADSSFTTKQTCKDFYDANAELIGPTIAEEAQRRNPEKYRNRPTFTYDANTNCVTCSAGSVLTERERYYDRARDTTIVSFTNPAACQSCAQLTNCTKSKLGYRTYKYDTRSVYQEKVLSRYKSEEGTILYKRRSHVAETYQGDLKHNGRMIQLLRRGINKVLVDSVLMDTVWNLRRIWNATQGAVVWS